ncbi:hypothetical protein Y032_0159g3280 [Ancylostoma ceylanicum]|uniref:Uncharacterized protein n=1 Tax=Ancylostoma ceylanicum TaxID=53326 RepID=A0A016SXJ2_9BILA|nr:hypothetical protein Y032_0159g3280 [Ancylostoma ceylanicum]
MHGLFVLSLVRVKQVGVANGPNGPIRVVWSRPFFAHDDTHPKFRNIVCISSKKKTRKNGYSKFRLINLTESKVY